MAERRLDRATKDIVQNAWNSLIQRYQKDAATDEYHWTDNEGDAGFLKDVDALNALIEPYLFSPTSFVDPPLKLDDFATRLTFLLNQVSSASGDLKDGPNKYLGFSASPYPYFQLEIDFVDSASAVLRLICNAAKLFTVQKQSLPKNLEQLMSGVSQTATTFLLQARIDDNSGIRWSAFDPNQVPAAAKYANLFFTNAAALSLHTGLDTPLVRNWIGTHRDVIESTLRKVITWIAALYDRGTNGFWMDEAHTQMQPMGVLYALEVLYTVADTFPDELRQNGNLALTAVFEKMSDLGKASALQRDFFHSLPMPGSNGLTFYDDRKYIGAFLSLFTLAKLKDPNGINDAYLQAAGVLYSGVNEEWIDEPSRLWDDGRPLICFTLDALNGLVFYVTQGKVDTVNLSEYDLRYAMRDALKSDEVVDIVFTMVMEKARSRKEKELTGRLSSGARAGETASR